jgi:hypothetical protein
MNIITPQDLQDWASTHVSKGMLPYLLARLIHATTPASTRVYLPFDTGIYIGGYDGKVQCEKDTNYVLAGASVWEFSTRADCQKKADEDYVKRCGDSLGYDPDKSTFIFVTPRLWTGKDAWERARQAEGIWKNVRAYDSTDLALWLSLANGVSRWFAGHINKYPHDGIMTADDFWTEWSVGPRGCLTPEIVTAGREAEQRQILEMLRAPASIKGIKASTKSESIAFIVATAKLFPVNDAGAFFSRALIIDTEGNYRAISHNATQPLALIPRFDDAQPMYHAVSKNHHVLVPLGGDDTFNQDVIHLPGIDRGGQVDSLLNMGIDPESAEQYSREAGRNVTILKKLIGFPSFKSDWAVRQDVREIFPAVLLGRWNETFPGDIELIERLSGRSYTDYADILAKWKGLPDSPILQIGETWRLTSPLDVWTTLSTTFKKSDLDQLADQVLYTFGSGNPVIELAGETNYFPGRRRKFSAWAREGLAQSLILVGRYGNMLRGAQIRDAQAWVDQIVFSLLDRADGSLWRSLNDALPLLSEASPSSFLQAAAHSLSLQDKPIMHMFREEMEFFTPVSSHTGLLWALEGLAWLPEYLQPSSSLLLQLADLDPGGTLSNRPINSLAEIWKPWRYQTLAPYAERMDTLAHITAQHPKSGWKLLMRMWPETHPVAQPTFKMRWRLFDKNTHISYTYQEIWDTQTTVMRLSLTLFDGSEATFAGLVEKSVNLSPVDRDTFLSWAITASATLVQADYVGWHTIRRILSHHRSHPEMDWALPSQELLRYDELYTQLTPKDLIQQSLWLFDSPWPQFPGGNFDKKSQRKFDHQQLQQIFLKERVHILQQLLTKLPLSDIIALRTLVKEPATLGAAFAELVEDEKDLLTVCQTLSDQLPSRFFGYGFLRRKFDLIGWPKMMKLFESVQRLNMSPVTVAYFFVALPASQSIWDYLSQLSPAIRQSYWSHADANFYNLSPEEKDRGIGLLMEAERYLDALQIASLNAEDLRSSTLITILTNAATKKSAGGSSMKSYDVETIFEVLDNRNDMSPTELANLEWMYLSVLADHGTRRNPRVLHQEMSKNPQFFAEILRAVYLPESEEDTPTVPDELDKAKAQQAYLLLHTWQAIPGMQPDQTIAYKVLRSWIEEVRELARASHHEGVAEMEIGRVLAQYPEAISKWPPEVIFQLIEEIGTDRLRQEYRIAMFNKRGFSARSPFEGGTVERAHAAYFDQLAGLYKRKFPSVAQIFNHLADGYLHDATTLDDEATRTKLDS